MRNLVYLVILVNLVRSGEYYLLWAIFRGALTVIWNIQGNIWHACAIKYIDNIDSRFNMLNCMINNNYNPYKAALRYIFIIIDPEMLWNKCGKYPCKCFGVLLHCRTLESWGCVSFMFLCRCSRRTGVDWANISNCAKVLSGVVIFRSCSDWRASTLTKPLVMSVVN